MRPPVRAVSRGLRRSIWFMDRFRIYLHIEQHRIRMRVTLRHAIAMEVCICETHIAAQNLHPLRMTARHARNIRIDQMRDGKSL